MGDIIALQKSRGAFVVRESSSKPGAFCLSFKYDSVYFPIGLSPLLDDDQLSTRRVARKDH